jgi:hypothetical protein
LIQTFKHDQHQASHCNMSSIVCRRRAICHFPAVDDRLRRDGTSIVVRGHRRTVGASIADGQHVADLNRRERAVAPQRIRCFAHRPHDIGADRLARPRRDGFDRMPGVVQRRPEQVRHSRVHHDEPAAVGPAFQIDNGRHEHARGAGDPAAGLEQHGQIGATHRVHHDCGIFLDAHDRLIRLIGDAEPAAKIDVFQTNAVVGEAFRERDQRFRATL